MLRMLCILCTLCMLQSCLYYISFGCSVIKGVYCVCYIYVWCMFCTRKLMCLLCMKYILCNFACIFESSVMFFFPRRGTTKKKKSVGSVSRSWLLGVFWFGVDKFSYLFWQRVGNTRYLGNLQNANTKLVVKCLTSENFSMILLSRYCITLMQSFFPCINRAQVWLQRGH